MNFEKRGTCRSGGRKVHPLISHSDLWLPRLHVKISLSKILKSNCSWLEVGTLHSCLRQNLKALWVVSRLEKSIYHLLWYHCIQKKSDIPKADISNAQQLTLKQFRWRNSATGKRSISVCDSEAPLRRFSSVVSLQFWCQLDLTAQHNEPRIILHHSTKLLIITWFSVGLQLQKTSDTWYKGCFLSYFQTVTETHGEIF